MEHTVRKLTDAIAETERKKGEWIKDEVGTTICSECKRPRRDNRSLHINFCNSCGAEMKGEDNEKVEESER